LPLQQPPAQDVALHTHSPPLQACPAAHAPHAAPPVPQEPLDWLPYGSQVLPLQHPFGHEPGVHTQAPAALHTWPAAHAPHAAPPVPHWVPDSDEYGTQTLPLQQPPGHEVASHTHAPVALLHSSPALHALHDEPPAPHDAFDSLASASHVVPLQHPAHDEPPQVQVPAVHAWPVEHALHAAPPVPH